MEVEIETRLQKAASRLTSRFALFTKYYLGDQVKQDELGGASSTCGGHERCIQGFGCGHWMERDNLLDLGQMEYYYGS